MLQPAAVDLDGGDAGGVEPRQASTLAEQERRCEEHAALVTELAGAPNSIARSMLG
ncbi:hypothetical protein ACFQ10_11325 [Streptomyces indonesiensis]